MEGPIPASSRTKIDPAVRQPGPAPAQKEEVIELENDGFGVRGAALQPTEPAEDAVCPEQRNNDKNDPRLRRVQGPFRALVHFLSTCGIIGINQNLTFQKVLKEVS